MLKEYAVWLTRAFRLFDVLLILLSFLFVRHFYFYQDVADQLERSSTFQQVLLLWTVFWFFVAKRLRIYDSRRIESFIYEVWDVVKAAAIAMSAAIIPALFFKPLTEGLKFFASVFVFQIFVLVAFRSLLRKSLRYLRSRGYNFRRVLIVGCNERAARLAQEIESSPQLGLHVIGFIDAPNGNGRSCNGYHFNVLGTLDDLERIARERVIDEVFIRLPIKSFYSEIEKILRFCETVGVDAKVPADLFNLDLSKSAVSDEFGLPVIDLYTSPRMNGQLLLKRFMDVCISLLLLIAWFPLMLVVAILIKTTSRGPVFFKQQRVGYNGRLFTLWKFRTMVNDADTLKERLKDLNEVYGPAFKIKDDPRITKIGKFLRRTSIDEIPQLWNVLRGDMSLVGPRPPVPKEVEQYILRDRRRLSVKPGITGVWQVCGRNCVPFDKWMEMDRQYIDEWSIWLDLKILAKTLPAVFRGTGL